MHYVDWSGGQHGHLLYDPFEDEAALLFGNHHHICPEMKKALQGVFLIAEQKKRIEESTKVRRKSSLLITGLLTTRGLRVSELFISAPEFRGAAPAGGS